MIAVPYRKLVVALLLGAALAGCNNEPDPNSHEGKRQALFKQMLRQTEPMSGMLTGRVTPSMGEFMNKADTLAQLADQPWEHFPTPGDAPEPNRTKDTVWSDPEGFALAIDDFKTKVADLHAVTSVGIKSLDQAADELRAVQQSCKSCHDSYRQ
ncbi:cytochrome c [Halopseudomonas aestusnigri]|uniref:c-type cytochrome n=1 Tax=Halopseudomonas aestusnigri TaxID=857252 RepID=UPI0028C0F41A|nr:cytochrome c [Halopseudomonas aestusnigri]